MSHKHEYRKPGRRVQRTPSFVTVPPGEEEESISFFTVLTNMGVPILYLVAASCVIIAITCMSIITKYWADFDPPQCFLYSPTPTSFTENGFVFGTDLSSCRWVAYGGIPTLIGIIVCGVLYVFHVRDDKEIDIWSAIVVGVMFLSTILLLAVACTLTQGVRITCTSVSLNNINNRSFSCKDKIDQRADPHKLPVQTSTMITVTSASLWSGVTAMILICAFHVALVIRRRATAYDDY